MLTPDLPKPDTPTPDHVPSGKQRPVTARLHPRIYAIAVGLSVWLILSVWLFASSGGEVNYLLFIVSGFVFMAVALPWILSRVTRDGAATEELESRQPYRDWATSQFGTWQGRLSGTAAAVQILLPIAAVAIGMTVFG